MKRDNRPRVYQRCQDSLESEESYTFYEESGNRLSRELLFLKTAAEEVFQHYSVSFLCDCIVDTLKGLDTDRGLKCQENRSEYACSRCSNETSLIIG